MFQQGLRGGRKIPRAAREAGTSSDATSSRADAVERGGSVEPHDVVAGLTAQQAQYVRLQECFDFGCGFDGLSGVGAALQQLATAAAFAGVDASRGVLQHGPLRAGASNAAISTRRSPAFRITIESRK